MPSSRHARRTAAVILSKAAMTPAAALLCLSFAALPSRGQDQTNLTQTQTNAVQTQTNIASTETRTGVKRVLLVVPRMMGRTALNMVTFRNRESAVMQWVDMAAIIADAETTRRSINRGSTEYNPFLGRRPSGPRTYATLLTIGFGYATMTQAIQERVENPRPFKLGLTAMAVTAHTYVAYHNTTVCPGNTTCNVPAN